MATTTSGAHERKWVTQSGRGSQRKKPSNKPCVRAQFFNNESQKTRSIQRTVGKTDAKGGGPHANSNLNYKEPYGIVHMVSKINKAQQFKV